MSDLETHNNRDGLEDFFNKNLYDASMQPRKMSWENIEAALDLEKKEKRKKRFFWFFISGFVLLVGTSLTWFVLFTNPSQSTIASNNINTLGKNVQSQETKSIKVQYKKSTNEAVSVSASNTNKQKQVNEKKSTETKIQLGAFSKKISLDKFKKVPFDVQSETSEDGITRYFVLTENGVSDLEIIKNVGFSDAFIKKDNQTESYTSLTTNMAVSKEVGYTAENKNNSHTSSTTGHNEMAIASKTKINNEESNEQAPISINNSSPSSKNKSQQTDEVVNTNSTNSKSQTTSSIPVKELVASTGTKTESLQSTNLAPENNKQVASQKNNTDAITSSDSPSINLVSADSIPQKETIPETKKDSVLQIAKVDSIGKPIQQPIKKDSAKIIPDYRWALSLIGGPNVYLNHAKTQLFDPKTESQKITYGGEIKAEYNFIKGFSASIGVGYQSQSIQKDSTRFTFSKYTTSDYIVNSSFGPMAIDNSTLLQGFFIIAPVDSFFAAYKYTSTIQSINVPLQINWYFLNKSRVKLYSSVGINANYVVSQKSHLTLIKEHHVDDIYYKNIQANKLNGILLLSLGCDVRLTKRWYFTLAPSYKYALTNHSKVSGIVFKPTYISATGGFKYRF